MKQILFIILLICFPFSNSFAQETSKTLNSTTTQVDSLKSDLANFNEVPQISEDTIIIKKKFTEVYGYKNGELLNYADYKVLFANIPDALSLIELSKSHHRLGNLFGFVGGFMFGFIGVIGLKNIGSVDYTWGKALGISAAVTGIGFLIYQAGNFSQIKAINIYNKKNNNYRVNEKIGYLKVGFTNSGIGIAYNF
jgi:hypothetical protein